MCHNSVSVSGADWIERPRTPSRNCRLKRPMPRVPRGVVCLNRRELLKMMTYRPKFAPYFQQFLPSSPPLPESRSSRIVRLRPLVHRPPSKPLVLHSAALSAGYPNSILFDGPEVDRFSLPVPPCPCCLGRRLRRSSRRITRRLRPRLSRPGDSNEPFSGQLGEAGTVRALPEAISVRTRIAPPSFRWFRSPDRHRVWSRDPNATEAGFNARPVRCVFQVADRPGLPTDLP